MPWPAVQHLGLPVSDPRRSCAFYRDLLGFRELQVNDHIAELTMGETKLVLLRAEAPVAPRDMHFGFAVATEADVDEWARKAAVAGVKIESGPARAEWGGYTVHFRDPDGYLIEIWAGH